jgi:hypothetical protein
MSTVSRPPLRANSRRKPERFVRLSCRSELVVITVDSKAVSYHLICLHSDIGAAYRLQKLDPTGQPDGVPYDICLTALQDSCECLGFLRWHRCKHVAALRKLIEKRLLLSSTHHI